MGIENNPLANKRTDNKETAHQMANDSDWEASKAAEARAKAGKLSQPPGFWGKIGQKMFAEDRDTREYELRKSSRLLAFAEEMDDSADEAQIETEMAIKAKDVIKGNYVRKNFDSIIDQADADYLKLHNELGEYEDNLSKLNPDEQRLRKDELKALSTRHKRALAFIQSLNKIYEESFGKTRRAQRVEDETAAAA